LPEETRRRLEENAAREGQPLEAYIRGVLDAQARTEAPSQANSIPAAELSVEEFERELDHLNDGLPPLLDRGFAYDREDIYFDHD
jgi:plasmid stability protein